jgi:hypothetical protein
MPGQGAGPVFNLYYQTQVAGFTDNGGNLHSLAGPPTYFTIVAGFQERISSTSIDVSTGLPIFNFQFVPGGNNYFEIYTNAGTGPNNSAGTGFNNGTLIMSGTVFSPNSNGSIGSFKVTSVGPPAIVLDQAPADKGPPDITPALFGGPGPDSVKTKTTMGNGATTISVAVDPTKTNTGYFPQPPKVIQIDFNTINSDPFSQVQPSVLFVAGPTGSGLTLVPNLGPNPHTNINGQTGTDVELQVSGTNSFLVAIPEPSSWALVTVGLVFGLVGRSRLLRKKCA